MSISTPDGCGQLFLTSFISGAAGVQPVPLFLLGRGGLAAGLAAPSRLWTVAAGDTLCRGASLRSDTNVL